MKTTGLIALTLLALSANAYAVDAGAVLGGAVGGGAGAAIGSEIGGRNGAILGGAIGGATGAAIGSKQESRDAPVRVRTRQYQDDDYSEHRDNGRHLGQRKHRHGRND